MGQYFRIVNLDKEQYLDPLKFGDSLRLFEFGGLTMTGLTVLLSPEADAYFDRELPLIGSWAGDRVIVAGDEDGSGEALSEDQVQRFESQPDAAAHMEEFDIDWPSVFLYARFCCVDISEQLMYAMCDCDYLKDEIEEATSSIVFPPGPYRDEIRRRLTGDEE